MCGSIAFSAKSRTVRARCFLNASSNMTKPKCYQAKIRCYLKSTARKMVKAGLWKAMSKRKRPPTEAASRTIKTFVARYRGGWRPEFSHSLTCVAVSICPTFLRSSSRAGPGFNWCALCSRRAFCSANRSSNAWGCEMERGMGAPPSLFGSGGSATLSVTDGCRYGAMITYLTPAICPRADGKV